MIFLVVGAVGIFQRGLRSLLSSFWLVSNCDFAFLTFIFLQLEDGHRALDP